MEKSVAILMADLSGYSALTEAHGAATAASLIDKYIRIAKKCLVGDCKLHQQTGDEIMFVSSSSDYMLATTQHLSAAMAAEEHFLQVHGGLHYGKVLKHGGNYFGSAVNLAARIAATAAAGTFYCSADFVNAISDKSACVFQSMGKYLLKNISEEKEIFELSIEKIETHFIDPVCRMLILHPANAFRHPDNGKLHFCSLQCLEVYKENQNFLHSRQQLN